MIGTFKQGSFGGLILYTKEDIIIKCEFMNKSRFLDALGTWRTFLRCKGLLGV
jgi:hypothetical protein